MCKWCDISNKATEKSLNQKVGKRLQDAFENFHASVIGCGSDAKLCSMHGLAKAFGLPQELFEEQSKIQFTPLPRKRNWYVNH